MISDLEVYMECLYVLHILELTILKYMCFQVHNGNTET